MDPYMPFILVTIALIAVVHYTIYLKLRNITRAHSPASTPTQATPPQATPPQVVIVSAPSSTTDNGPRPPERSMPINVRTRGDPGGYQQVGTLSSSDGDGEGKQILPLYGRPTYRGSSKWNYFTSTDGYHLLRIPVFYRDKDCSHEFGCDEVSDGDDIYVREYDRVYRVAIYGLDEARYIPEI
jgi:hypothetical protein